MTDAMHSEAARLGMAAALIEEARRVLDGKVWTSGELHLLAEDLTDTLAGVHGVAEKWRPRSVPAGSGAVFHVPLGEPVQPCRFPCAICRRAGRRPVGESPYRQ
ncbi:hypothetical protein [Streptomyces halobius]|uniref:Uncharacterized protein n=1 Tax=Streptomyces halobius TaxID=2879846 RepID=A0ABY4M5E2_9ACTN|nr:hypothetical protein [Streptomyces halobius]UQA92982.1 hypothetical protein K9S39_15080 [Streptomyces halobius]